MKTSKSSHFIAYVALLMISATTHAGFWGGTKLMQILESDFRGDATYDVGLATGYIMGVADTATGSVVCMPSSVTVKQTKQVVFNYMKNHPEKWNYSADVSIIAGLKKTWPCKKQ